MLTQALGVVGGSALALAVFEDVRQRILPNRYLLVAGLCGVAEAALQPNSDLLPRLGLAIASLILLWPLVSRGWLGGGDAKMVPAALLLVSPSQAPLLGCTLVLAGGLLGLIMLIMRGVYGGKSAFPEEPLLKPANPWSLRDQISAGVPYGAAIWIGLIVTKWAAA